MPPISLKDHPDLPPSFRVLPANQDLRIEDLKQTDGTPMAGPDGLLAPPGRQFSMVLNTGTRVYSYRFDEAMRDNQVGARAMRRDAFLEGLFEERILPTINREWQLEVDDAENPKQRKVRDGLTQVIKAIPDFDAFKRANLDGVWFGRAGCQWAYERRKDLGDKWCISRWDPIHGDSLQFTFDGVPAVMLDAQTVGWYTSHGATVGQHGDIRSTDRGGVALVLQRPYWRDRFSIHVHMRRKADYFEGELAGSVQGLGLRGMVYWQYVVRTDALTWMLGYMQAVGQMDLLIFNYPSNDAAAKLQQENNASKIIGKAAIACPRDPKGNWPAVEQVPMNAAGLKALQGLITDYFDRHIERLFVGQSMSAGADKGTGLGGTGRAEFTKACVPVEGSEILTRDGFKSPQAVMVGEDVLAYDAETDKCRWTPLLKKSFFDDCEVSRLYTGQNRFDVLCTPDHSWAVEKTQFRSYRREPDMSKMEVGPRGALRFANQKRYLKHAQGITRKEHIILSAPLADDSSESLLTPTEAAVLGWAITDGNIRVHDGKFSGVRYEISICQSKEKFLPLIRELMHKFTGRVQELVVDFPSMPDPNHMVSGKKVRATLPQRWWRASRDQSTDMLNKCGFRTQADLPRIATRLDGPARRAMLEAIVMGDGSETGGFTNTDPHVFECFDILCALEGKASGRLRAKRHDPKYGHKQCYDKNVRKSRYIYGDYLKIEPAGRADVWCPTTKYGTWVMRQNGAVMVTGNTKDEILIYDTGRLDATFTADLVAPLLRYNYPWADFPVRFKSVLPDLKAKEKVESGSKMISVGVPIKLDEYREAAGFSRPKPGDEVIAMPMPGGPPVITIMGLTGPDVPPSMGGQMGLPPGAPIPGSTPGGTVPGIPPGPFPPPNPMPNIGMPQIAGPAGPPGGAPTPNALQGPHGGSNSVFGGNAGLPKPIRHDAGAGVAPSTGPVMGYPGGGNTYIPSWKKPERQYDQLGFIRYTAEPHDYCSTQINLDGYAGILMNLLSRDIAAADLHEKGREDDPHTTIRYGLHANVTAADVSAMIGKQAPPKLFLGKVSCFPASDTGKDYDVLKVDVDSPDLVKMNKLLGELPNTQTFDYHPHATLAYLKPGRAQKYVDAFKPLNVGVTGNVVVFSDCDNNKTLIDLNPGQRPKPPSGVGLTTNAPGTRGRK